MTSKKKKKKKKKKNDKMRAHAHAQDAYVAWHKTTTWHETIGTRCLCGTIGERKRMTWHGMPTWHDKRASKDDVAQDAYVAR